uniref:Flagellar basal body rod protein N-terminal domain-containing protein n=1 Tax=Schlesneria paludicola TaxID=360056 RepID=A0A7C4LKS4_9PLAN
MLSPLLDQTPLPLLKQVARFTERRQEVLAGNVANIDTPGYRMRDLPVAEFRQALARAIAQLPPPADSASRYYLTGELPPASPAGLRAPPSLEELFPETLFQAHTPREQPGITFQDANNRSLEQQFLQMTRNTLWQNFAVELLRRQFDQLQMVITERP